MKLFKTLVLCLFIESVFLTLLLKPVKKDSLLKARRSSFLQVATKSESSLESSLSSEEKALLEDNLKNMFLAQLSSRKKKRYTKGGKLCASVFVQDKITYYDCTQAQSPDGKDKKSEWCYIEIHAQEGGKTWDYCKPIIDYDKVREKNQYELNVITIACRKTNTDLTPYISQSEAVIKEFFEVRKGQADIDNKIAIMNKSLKTLLNNLNFLYLIMNQWTAAEKKAIAISSDIDKQEAELVKKREENQKKKKEYWSSEPVSLKNQALKYNMVINPKMMRKEKSKETNCEGLSGYEEDKLGDGLLGEYYDNEAWIGNSIQRTDPNINFFWIGSPPMKGLNAYNFSVRWTGYLKAPFTGNYVFEIETVDSVLLNINNKVVIAHNMQTAPEESVERTNNWLQKEVDKFKNPLKSTTKSRSQSISLIGGNKYKIVLSYYHSIHNLLKKEFEAFVKLSWSSDDFDTNVIPKTYLYTKNEYQPLKPMGLDNNEVVLAQMDENTSAFKNSDRFFLQDIPEEYRGLKSLKFTTRFTKPNFEMNINSPHYIYIGILSHYPNPLPDYFENMASMISVVEVDPKLPFLKGKRLQGINSAVFNIYRKKFEPGKVTFPLKRIGPNEKGIPWILFFGPDTSGSTPISCGGKENLLSLPGSASYKSCENSSNFSSYSCTDGLMNKLQDKAGAMWASYGQGIGAWLKIIFNGLFMVTRFDIKPRGNPNERTKIFELEFSDGSSQRFTIVNTDSIQSFNVERVQTQYVIVKIVEVYGTINNGGAFNFYGIECKNLKNEPNKESNGILKAAGVSPKELEPIFKDTAVKVVNLSCKENFSNSKKFLKTKMGLNDRVIVNCFSSCALTPWVIYGTGKYTKDSAICKAAFHDKKITSAGGHVEVVFSLGLSQYTSSKSNGIISESKTFSEVTYSFSAIKKAEEIIVKEGNKVDLLDPSSNNKYVSATITDIKESLFGKQLELTVAGQTKPIIMPYPNKNKILPCGEKIEGLDCNSSRKTINKNRPVLIRFITKDYKASGNYLPDFGGVYGSTGKAFGWSKDISNRFKNMQGKSPKEPLLETAAHFPPSPSSKYCKKEIPDIVCDKVDWSVKVGEGKFVVRLIFGDPLVNSKIDLCINGIPAFNKILEKGKLMKVEKSVESKQGFITVSSTCETDCDFSMAKLSAVELIPFSEETKVDEDGDVEKIGCGGSLTQGKCDKGDDVLHCLFDKASDPKTKNCTGEYVLMEIGESSTCKQDRGKFKCVMKQYKNSVDCKKYCPSNCKKNVCAS